MQKINHMNATAFVQSLESEQSKLLDKGKRLIAEKLIESFELDGESCTGKQINIRGNKVTLHTRNPAM